MRLARLLAAAVILPRDPTTKWANDPLLPWFRPLIASLVFCAVSAAAAIAFFALSPRTAFDGKVLLPCSMGASEHCVGAPSVTWATLMSAFGGKDVVRARFAPMTTPE